MYYSIELLDDVSTISYKVVATVVFALVYLLQSITITLVQRISTASTNTEKNPLHGLYSVPSSRNSLPPIMSRGRLDDCFACLGRGWLRRQILGDLLSHSSQGLESYCCRF